MPPSEITATSLVPPPTSTTIRPTGSAIGSPAPIAAASDSSIRCTSRAPALRDASSTARRSTSVTPEGAHMTSRGRLKRLCEHLVDELAQHRLGDLEVGDHAVAQRAVGRDRGRRAADHQLGVGADRVDLAGALVDRHHRRLGQHDPAPAHVDDRVRGAEVDRHVADRPQRGQRPAAPPLRAEDSPGERMADQHTGAPVRFCHARCIDVPAVCGREPRVPRNSGAVGLLHRDPEPGAGPPRRRDVDVRRAGRRARPRRGGRLRTCRR